MASIAENKFALQFVDPTVSFDPVRGTATADSAEILASGTRFPQPSSNRQFYDAVRAMKIADSTRRYTIWFNPGARITEWFHAGPNPDEYVFQLADVESVEMEPVEIVGNEGVSRWATGF